MKRKPTRKLRIKTRLDFDGWYAFINDAEFSACNHPHDKEENAKVHAKMLWDKHLASLVEAGEL